MVFWDNRIIGLLRQAAIDQAAQQRSSDTADDRYHVIADIGLKQLRRKAAYRRRTDMIDPWAIRCRKAKTTLRSRAS